MFSSKKKIFEYKSPNIIFFVFFVFLFFSLGLVYSCKTYCPISSSYVPNVSAFLTSSSGASS